MKIFFCFILSSSFLMGQSKTECDKRKYREIEKTLPSNIIQILAIDTLEIKKEPIQLNKEISLFKGKEIRNNNYLYFIIEYDDATFIKIRQLPLFKKITTDFNANNDTISGMLTIRSIFKTYEFAIKEGLIINTSITNRKMTKLRYNVDYSNFYKGINWPNFKHYFKLSRKHWEGVYFVCESNVGSIFIRKRK